MRLVLTVPDLVVNRCQGFQLNYSGVNKSPYACLNGRFERSLEMPIFSINLLLVYRDWLYYS